MMSERVNELYLFLQRFILFNASSYALFIKVFFFSENLTKILKYSTKMFRRIYFFIKSKSIRGLLGNVEAISISITSASRKKTKACKEATKARND
jgi:hypothetical protein